MLTKEGWRSFEEAQGWREILETVKARMLLITQDILSPETCNSEEKRVKFQQEYLTCLWFINLPKYDSSGGEDEKAASDLNDLPATPAK